MNRLTYTIPKDHLTSAQHRKATESTPEHIVFSGKTAGGDTVTYRMDPEDFYRHADHLLAARVEELLTVNENEVNEALAAVEDMKREVGVKASAIRAGIRKRFRTSTGTPAIEDFAGRETCNCGPNEACSNCPARTTVTVGGGSGDAYSAHNTSSAAGNMVPSGEAIDGGNEEG